MKLLLGGCQAHNNTVHMFYVLFVPGLLDGIDYDEGTGWLCAGDTSALCVDRHPSGACAALATPAERGDPPTDSKGPSTSKQLNPCHEGDNSSSTSLRQRSL